MLSNERIAEIKRRKDAATPGPWECLSAEFTKRGVNFEMVMSEKVIAFPDGVFLANSISDISDLLDEREELVRELEGKSEGVKLIAAERERQVSVEGWTPEHDDAHNDQSLIDAALVYADFGGACQRGATIKELRGIYLDSMENITWSWKPKLLKLSPDPIRNLVKAGALIAAEIDRLKRLPVAPEVK